MTTVYPGGGNAQNIDNANIHGVDTTLGDNIASDGYPETPDNDYVDYVNNSTIERAGQHMNFVDIALGSDVATHPDVHAIVGERRGSAPSGYNVNGDPTYGDGQMDVNTTFPADNEISTGGQFTYFAPADVVNKDYSALSS